MSVLEISYIAQIEYLQGLPEVVIKIKPIKGVKAFTNAIKNSVRIKSDKAVAYVTFYENIDRNLIGASANSAIEDTFIFNYGIVLSKKIIKKAVVRNRIKRLIRESLRKLTQEFGENLIVIKTMVISWHRNPLHPNLIKLDEVLSEMRFLFNKILSNNMRYN